MKIKKRKEINVKYNNYFVLTIIVFSLISTLYIFKAYPFSRYPFVTILLALIWIFFWIVLCYLIKKMILIKNFLYWSSFFGGIIAFFYTLFYVSLDPAGGLIQLLKITFFGIVLGGLICLLIKFVVIRFRKNGKK